MNKENSNHECMLEKSNRQEADKKFFDELEYNNILARKQNQRLFDIVQDYISRDPDIEYLDNDDTFCGSMRMIIAKYENYVNNLRYLNEVKLQKVLDEMENLKKSCEATILESEKVLKLCTMNKGKTD